VVCALLEEGEHGYLAARTVAQVIKAYVEKEHRAPSNLAKGTGKTEIGGVWNVPDPDGDGNGGDALRAGRLEVDLDKVNAPLAAAAPGIH